MEEKINGKNCLGRKIIEYFNPIFRDLESGGYVEMNTLAQGGDA